MNNASIRAVGELLRTKTPDDVHAGMRVGATLPTLEVLTFGMINTPITLNATDALCAYVVEWENGQTTVCKVDGDNCTVIGMEPVTGLDCAGALNLFERYWQVTP